MDLESWSWGIVVPPMIGLQFQQVPSSSTQWQMPVVPAPQHLQMTAGGAPLSHEPPASFAPCYSTFSGSLLYYHHVVTTWGGLLSMPLTAPGAFVSILSPISYQYQTLDLRLVPHHTLSSLTAHHDSTVLYHTEQWGMGNGEWGLSNHCH